MGKEKSLVSYCKNDLIVIGQFIRNDPPVSRGAVSFIPHHLVVKSSSSSIHNNPHHLHTALPIMSNSLEQLKATGTTVVCDSGDFATIGKYKAQDATTNPSLVLAASKKPEYAKLIDIAVEYGKEHVSGLFCFSC